MTDYRWPFFGIMVLQATTTWYFLILYINNKCMADAQNDGLQTTVAPFNLSKPTGHVMHQQFNIQQLYALPTLYLCVLYLFENKQRLVPLTA